MAQFGFYFDNTRCTGCRTCVMACKDYYDTPLDIAYRKLFDVEGGEWRQASDGTYSNEAFMYHVSLSCQHCDDPICVKVCPTTAMRKDEKYGIVSVDASKCIGCGYCAMACPYSAPEVDQDKGCAVKCDGCYDRLQTGKAPVCVDACPLRALEFDNIEILRQNHGTDDMIYPMPAPTATQPNIVIKASPATKLPDVAYSAIVSRVGV